MNIKGQGYSLTFVQGHTDSTFSNFFSSKNNNKKHKKHTKNTRPIETKFHMEPTWDIGKKICSDIPGHMTKMASKPIYGNNIQKSPTSEPRGR